MAIDVETSIRAYMLADTTVSTVVDARVFGPYAPESAVRPYVTMERTGSENITHLGGRSNVRVADIEIECVADDMATARDLKEKIRKRLDRSRGVALTTGGTAPASYHIQSMTVESDYDTVVPPSSNDDRPVYMSTMNITVWYAEAT